MQQVSIRNVWVQDNDSFIQFSTKDDMAKNTTVFPLSKIFSRFVRKPVSTYIKIVVPTVFMQKSQWLLWIAWNWGGVQIVGKFGFPPSKNIIH